MNDHIDDLFRRAADDYPLNTEGADWNKVLSGLQQSPGDDNGKSPKKNPRRLLWLLVLLPLAWICYDHYKNDSPANLPGTVQTGKKSATEPANQNNNQSQSIPDTTNTSTAHTDHEVGQFTPPVQPSTTSNKPVHSTTTTRIITQGVKRSPGGVGSTHYKVPVNMPAPKADRILAAGQRVNKVVIEKGIGSETPAEPVHADPASKTPTLQQHAEPANAAGDTLEKTLTPKAVEPATDIVSTSKMQAESPGHVGRFYVGLLAGTDMNFVEYQRVYKLGISAGVVAGYSFNNRLAVEAGAFLQQKHYYSTGEYFDIKRTTIPANYKIESIAGKCTMIDLSLNVRYNFINSASGSWFASAGASSYIMKKELYDYSYKYNWQTMFRRLNYANSTNNFFAIGNISLGYQHHFARGLNARIEPYVKVPLKGIGIGDIPLMSAGIQAGFTKSIF